MHRIFRKLARFFKNNWRMAVLDTHKGLWIVNHDNIPYLKAQNANGRHILIQPALHTQACYLLADDLNQELLNKHHRDKNNGWKKGRMVIETSPGNYQVWIHSSRTLTLQEKRYWLKKMHSDPGADPNRRWGRCPGFFNRKDKYRNDSDQFPLSKLIWVDWHSVANIPLIASGDSERKNYYNRYAPKYEQRISHIRRTDYERCNESVTDFAYALALARRNFSKQQIIQRLLKERQDWTKHKGENRKIQYLDRTVSKTINIIASNK